MARFMISMPDEMLKKLDDAARKEHRSRSELLREAARHHLNADVQAKAAQSLSSKDETRNGKKNINSFSTRTLARAWSRPEGLPWPGPARRAGQ